MLDSRTNGPRSLAVAATFCLLTSTVGCGELADEDEAFGVSEEALAGQVINCPTEVTVDWIQAANGRTNTVRGKTRAIIFRDQPNPNLICRFEPTALPIIQQLVSLKPGSVQSACGAKATISGRGASSGGVPPFGGFVFKSRRIQAASAYDQSSGLCLLTLPSSFPTAQFSLKMTKGCRSQSDEGFVCPTDALIVN